MGQELTRLNLVAIKNGTPYGSTSDNGVLGHAAIAC
jgi:hypothetical protein